MVREGLIMPAGWISLFEPSAYIASLFILSYRLAIGTGGLSGG